MKLLIVAAIGSLFLLTQGCTSFDKSGAGVETASVNPTSSTVPPSNATVANSVDPAANGGTSLPASAPYSQASGGTAQQNVNPAPFMVATTEAGSAAGPPAGAGSPGLTSRADGTMSGPNDQPAATTGWGTQATNWAGSAASTTTSSRPPKGSKK